MEPTPISTLLELGKESATRTRFRIPCPSARVVLWMALALTLVGTRVGVPQAFADGAVPNTSSDFAQATDDATDHSGHDHGHDHGDGTEAGEAADHVEAAGHEAAGHEVDAHGGGHSSNLADKLPWYSVVPFALLLICIAILPLVAEHWWESLKVRGLVTFLLSAPIGIYLLIHGRHELGHSMLEYVAFIALLGSLFVISSGVVLSGDLRATPKVNVAFLAIGAVLANFIGTTGASMLLIRPLLKTNSERKLIKHIPIFFIFIVSNIGGSLTPLGDPPLFLGYLRGVPFTWTFALFPQWLFCVVFLLITFFIWDTVMYKREAPEDIAEDSAHVNPLSLRGSYNFLFLGGVIGAVFLPMAWRIGAMFALAVAAYMVTPRHLRLANHFSFFPINEVAILFAGIFVTVVPALVLLEANGQSLGLDQPWQFFWLTGILSSVLDNAPTYLTFTSLSLGLYDLPGGGADSLLALVHHPEGQKLLTAISMGAVFMGANTYIGNGPNFMVKAIVEDRNVPRPISSGTARIPSAPTEWGRALSEKSRAGCPNLFPVPNRRPMRCRASIPLRPSHQKYSSRSSR